MNKKDRKRMIRLLKNGCVEGAYIGIESFMKDLEEASYEGKELEYIVSYLDIEEEEEYEALVGNKKFTSAERLEIMQEVLDDDLYFDELLPAENDEELKEEEKRELQKMKEDIKAIATLDPDFYLNYEFLFKGIEDEIDDKIIQFDPNRKKRK